ncbi:hypothetical protein LNV08_22060 [Paucibacter sp. TC2R-5]|uniref:hypothetical protein n=1 Tax=Paucibacter sp. TC2R-5 TaxID=2893555 RepID=UPI0021E43D00|nr:hypothetical protein [Paucibacter sp. TC2R-5]MCV2361659.1 hypothetical protein [Paucibacter sp. TC2R-5]
MKKIAQYIAARLREPSTLSGLAAVGVLFGLPAGTVDAGAAVVAGACAVLAVVLPDDWASK